MPPILPTLLFLSLCLTAPVRAEWETIKLDGEDYVTVDSIKSFYRFETLTQSGDVIQLESASVKMTLTVGSKEVFMNKVKFLFASKIRAHQGRHLVSRFDLTSTIEPVLRPSYIKKATPFQTVIIDPGHGGPDQGAASRFGKEKEFTLAVGQALKQILEPAGYKVIMTRDDDRLVSLKERVTLANEIQNAIFISLHFNSGPAGRKVGIETFTLSPAPGAVGGDKALTAASTALASAVHGSCLFRTNRPDGGIRRARFSILADVKHPAILLEGGFLSHPKEGRLITNRKYQQSLARAIAEGVGKYRNITTQRAPR